MLTDDYKQYQQFLLMAFIKWINGIIYGILVLNSLWFLKDFWGTLLQQSAALLILMIGLWCRRLLRQGQIRQAGRLYLTTGMCLPPVFVLSLGQTFIPNAALGLTIFILLASYLEPQNRALYWSGLGLGLYLLALTIRILFPIWEFTFPPIDMIGLYMFPLILLTGLTFLGRNSAGRLNAALRESEVARRELEHSNQLLVEVQRVLKTTNAQLQDELSERKRAEGQLLHLRRAVETMPLGVTITDLDGKIIYVNSAEAAMHGYQKEELLGKDIGIFAPPEFRKRVSLEEIKQWKGLIRESVNIRKDGRLFPVWLMSEIVKGVDGEPHTIVTSCEDISERKQTEAELEKYRSHLEELIEERTTELTRAVTETKQLNVQLQQEIAERKQAEVALRESEAELRAIFAAMEDIILILNEEGRYLDIAPTSPDLLYRPPGELIGRTLHEVFPPEQADLFLSHIRQALKTHHISHLEYNLQIGERLLWFAAAVSPMTEDTVVWVARDITARKRVENAVRESEEKFRALAQNSPDVIMRFDRAFKHLYVNPIIQDWIGIPPRDFIGKTHKELGFPTDLIAIWEEAIQQVFDTKDVHRIEFRLPNGVWVDWLLFPEFSPQGEVSAVLTSSRDITARKQAEEALEQAYQELQNTQAQLIQSGKLASIGELAAGVAHELNQPLMVIRTTTQFLQRSLKKGNLELDQLIRQFEPIGRNTKRMMNIINHLRAFSRQSQKEFSPQDVNTIIENSFLMVGEQLRLHSIEVQKNLTPNLPTVLGDANQLEQVVLNLLTNARDAIEAKGTRKPRSIEIITRISGENNIYVEMLVKDSGIGIAPDHLDSIFDPFFTTKEIGKGTGLGLSISYGIVKEHQGEIEVVETSPEGTTLRVTLPVGQFLPTPDPSQEGNGDSL